MATARCRQFTAHSQVKSSSLVFILFNSQVYRLMLFLYSSLLFFLLLVMSGYVWRCLVVSSYLWLSSIRSCYICLYLHIFAYIYLYLLTFTYAWIYLLILTELLYNFQVYAESVNIRHERSITSSSELKLYTIKFLCTFQSAQCEQ